MIVIPYFDILSESRQLKRDECDYTHRVGFITNDLRQQQPPEYAV